jgi:hypothetical protein
MAWTKLKLIDSWLMRLGVLVCLLSAGEGVVDWIDMSGWVVGLKVDWIGLVLID